MEWKKYKKLMKKEKFLPGKGEKDIRQVEYPGSKDAVFGHSLGVLGKRLYRNNVIIAFYFFSQKYMH